MAEISREVVKAQPLGPAIVVDRADGKSTILRGEAAERHIEQRRAEQSSRSRTNRNLNPEVQRLADEAAKQAAEQSRQQPQQIVEPAAGPQITVEKVGPKVIIPNRVVDVSRGVIDKRTGREAPIIYRDRKTGKLTTNPISEIRQESPSPLYDSINGENIQSSGSVGGVKFVRTESGKEYADIGGGSYMELGEYQRIQSDKRSEVIKDLSLRITEKKQPIIGATSRGLRAVESGVNIGMSAAVETAAPDFAKLMRRAAERFGLKRMRTEEKLGGEDVPLFSKEGLKRAAESLSPKTIERKGRATEEAFYFEPAGAAGAERRFSEILSPALTITGAATLGVGSGAARGASRLSKSREAFGELRAGEFGVRPPVTASGISKIIRRPKTVIKDVSISDSRTAVSKTSDTESTGITSSDFSFKAVTAGRERKFVGTYSGTSESRTLSEMETFQKSFGDVDISKVVSSPSLRKSRLEPSVNVKTQGQAYDFSFDEGRKSVTFAQSVAKVDGKRFGSAYKGLSRTEYERVGDGIVSLKGGRIPGTKEREYALVEYGRESGVRSLGVSGSPTPVRPKFSGPKGFTVSGKSVDFGVSRIFERKEPTLTGVGGAATQTRFRFAAPSSPLVASSIKAAARAAIVPKVRPDIVKGAVLRKVPRLSPPRNFRINPNVGQSTNFRFATGGTKSRRESRISAVGLVNLKSQSRGQRSALDAIQGETSIFSQASRKSVGERTSQRQFPVLKDLVGQSQTQGQRSAVAQRTATRQQMRRSSRSSTPSFIVRPPNLRFRLPKLPYKKPGEDRFRIRKASGFGPSGMTRYKPSLTARFVPKLPSTPKRVAGPEIRPFIRRSRV